MKVKRIQRGGRGKGGTSEEESVQKEDGWMITRGERGREGYKDGKEGYKEGREGYKEGR